jgi:hypothetical protein
MSLRIDISSSAMGKGSKFPFFDYFSNIMMSIHNSATHGISPEKRQVQLKKRQMQLEKRQVQLEKGRKNKITLS